MTALAIYSCCREHPAEVDDVAGPPAFVGPVDGPPPFSNCGPATGVVEAGPRNRRTAVHEAAHGCVQIALGGAVREITIEGQGLCKYAERLDFPLCVLVSLAGPIAANWVQRMIIGATDRELLVFIAGIRNLRGGGCDACSAVRHTIIGKFHAPDGVVLAEFRQLEALTLQLVRHPRLWAAILELADALMQCGTIDSDAVSAICARFFEPGAFINILTPEQNHVRF